MARTTSKANTNKVANSNVADFCIIGELTDVYEGSKKNYLTIKVEGDEINPKTKQPFYSLLKVTADKDIELYDDGTIVEIGGTISSYFDKSVSRSTMILTAGNVKPVSNG